MPTDLCLTTIKRGDAPRASVGKSPTLKSKSETLRNGDEKMKNELVTLYGAVCTEKNLYNLRPLSPLFPEEKKASRFSRFFRKGVK